MKWTNVAAGVMVLAAVGAAYVILGDDQGQPRPQSSAAAEAKDAGRPLDLKLQSTADWSNAHTGLAAVQAMEKAQVRGPQGCAERTPAYIEARDAAVDARKAADRETRNARRQNDNEAAQDRAREARREETIVEKRLAELQGDLEARGCIWPTDAQIDAMHRAQGAAIEGVIRTHDALTGTTR